MTLSADAGGRCRARSQADAARAGAAGPSGVMLPNSNGAVVTILALMSAGRVPAMINFTAGAANILAACRRPRSTPFISSRTFIEKGGRHGCRGDRREGEDRLSRRCRASVTLADKVRGLVTAEKPLVPTQGRRLGGYPVYIRFRGHAEGRRALPSQHARKRRASGRAHRLRPRRQGVQRPADLPFVRADGRYRCRSSPACRSISIRRPCITGPCRTGLRVNATIMFGTDTFLAATRRGDAYDFRSLRYILAGAEPVKESTRQSNGQIRAAHSRRLRRDRNRAGARINTPMYNSSAPSAASCPAWSRSSSKCRHRGGRPAVCARTERDARLSRRSPGVLAPPAGWLVRHRRYRRDRRARAS